MQPVTISSQFSRFIEPSRFWFYVQLQFRWDYLWPGVFSNFDAVMYKECQIVFLFLISALPSDYKKHTFFYGKHATYLAQTFS